MDQHVLSQIQEGLIEVSLHSQESQKILQYVNNSFLDRSNCLEWRPKSMEVIRNKGLANDFRQRKQDMEMMYHEVPNEKLVFVCVRDGPTAEQIASQGCTCKKSQFNVLGDGSKGVYVCKHADVQLRVADGFGVPLCKLIMFTMSIGRVREVAPVYDEFGLEPSYGYDCHMCSQTPLLEEPLHLQVIKSQVYAFELDKYGFPALRPRQILPLAVVTYEKLNPITSDALWLQESPLARWNINTANSSIYNPPQQHQFPSDENFYSQVSSYGAAQPSSSTMPSYGQSDMGLPHISNSFSEANIINIAPIITPQHSSAQLHYPVNTHQNKCNCPSLGSGFIQHVQHCKYFMLPPSSRETSQASALVGFSIPNILPSCDSISTQPSGGIPRVNSLSSQSSSEISRFDSVSTQVHSNIPRVDPISTQPSGGIPRVNSLSSQSSSEISRIDSVSTQVHGNIPQVDSISTQPSGDIPRMDSTIICPQRTVVPPETSQSVNPTCASQSRLPTYEESMAQKSSDLIPPSMIKKEKPDTHVGSRPIRKKYCNTPDTAIVLDSESDDDGVIVSNVRTDTHSELERKEANDIIPRAVAAELSQTESLTQNTTSEGNEVQASVVSNAQTHTNNSSSLESANSGGAADRSLLSVEDAAHVHPSSNSEDTIISTSQISEDSHHPIVSGSGDGASLLSSGNTANNVSLSSRDTTSRIELGSGDSASLNTENTASKTLQSSGDRPISIALSSGDAALRNILSSEDTTNKTSQNSGDTPISIALGSGDVALRNILSSEDTTNKTSQNSGDTPISIALGSGDAALVSYLSSEDRETSLMSGDTATLLGSGDAPGRLSGKLPKKDKVKNPKNRPRKKYRDIAPKPSSNETSASDPTISNRPIQERLDLPSPGLIALLQSSTSLDLPNPPKVKPTSPRMPTSLSTSNDTSQITTPGPPLRKGVSILKSPVVAKQPTWSNIGTVDQPVILVQGMSKTPSPIKTTTALYKVSLPLKVAASPDLCQTITSEKKEKPGIIRPSVDSQVEDVIIDVVGEGKKKSETIKLLDDSDAEDFIDVVNTPPPSPVPFRIKAMAAPYNLHLDGTVELFIEDIELDALLECEPQKPHLEKFQSNKNAKSPKKWTQMSKKLTGPPSPQKLPIKGSIKKRRRKRQWDWHTNKKKKRKALGAFLLKEKTHAQEQKINMHPTTSDFPSKDEGTSILTDPLNQAKTTDSPSKVHEGDDGSPIKNQKLTLSPKKKKKLKPKVKTAQLDECTQLMIAAMDAFDGGMVQWNEKESSNLSLMPQRRTRQARFPPPPPKVKAKKKTSDKVEKKEEPTEKSTDDTKEDKEEKKEEPIEKTADATNDDKEEKEEEPTEQATTHKEDPSKVEDEIVVEVSEEKPGKSNKKQAKKKQKKVETQEEVEDEIVAEVSEEKSGNSNKKQDMKKQKKVETPEKVEDEIVTGVSEEKSGKSNKKQTKKNQKKIETPEEAKEETDTPAVQTKAGGKKKKKGKGKQMNKKKENTTDEVPDEITDDETTVKKAVNTKKKQTKKTQPEEPIITKDSRVMLPVLDKAFLDLHLSGGSTSQKKSLDDDLPIGVLDSLHKPTDILEPTSLSPTIKAEDQINKCFQAILDKKDSLIFSHCDTIPGFGDTNLLDNAAPMFDDDDDESLPNIDLPSLDAELDCKPTELPSVADIVTQLEADGLPSTSTPPEALNQLREDILASSEDIPPPPRVTRSKTRVPKARRGKKFIRGSTSTRPLPEQSPLVDQPQETEQSLDSESGKLPKSEDIPTGISEKLTVKQDNESEEPIEEKLLEEEDEVTSMEKSTPDDEPVGKLGEEAEEKMEVKEDSEDPFKDIKSPKRRGRKPGPKKKSPVGETRKSPRLRAESESDATPRVTRSSCAKPDETTPDEPEEASTLTIDEEVKEETPQEINEPQLPSDTPEDSDDDNNDLLIDEEPTSKEKEDVAEEIATLTGVRDPRIRRRISQMIKGVDKAVKHEDSKQEKSEEAITSPTTSKKKPTVESDDEYAPPPKETKPIQTKEPTKPVKLVKPLRGPPIVKRHKKRPNMEPGPEFQKLASFKIPKKAKGNEETEKPEDSGVSSNKLSSDEFSDQGSIASFGSPYWSDSDYSNKANIRAAPRPVSDKESSSTDVPQKTVPPTKAFPRRNELKPQEEKLHRIAPTPDRRFSRGEDDRVRPEEHHVERGGQRHVEQPPVELGRQRFPPPREHPAERGRPRFAQPGEPPAGRGRFPQHREPPTDLGGQRFTRPPHQEVGRRRFTEQEEPHTEYGRPRQDRRRVLLATPRHEPRPWGAPEARWRDDGRRGWHGHEEWGQEGGQEEGWDQQQEEGWDQQQEQGWDQQQEQGWDQQQQEEWNQQQEWGEQEGWEEQEEWGQQEEWAEPEDWGQQVARRGPPRRDSHFDQRRNDWGPRGYPEHSQPKEHWEGYEEERYTDFDQRRMHYEQDTDLRRGQNLWFPNRKVDHRGVNPAFRPQPTPKEPVPQSPRVDHDERREGPRPLMQLEVKPPSLVKTDTTQPISPVSQTIEQPSDHDDRTKPPQSIESPVEPSQLDELPEDPLPVENNGNEVALTEAVESIHAPDLPETQESPEAGQVEGSTPDQSPPIDAASEALGEEKEEGEEDEEEEEGALLIDEETNPEDLGNLQEARWKILAELENLGSDAESTSSKQSVATSSRSVSTSQKEKPKRHDKRCYRQRSPERRPSRSSSPKQGEKHHSISPRQKDRRRSKSKSPNVRRDGGRRSQSPRRHDRRRSRSVESRRDATPRRKDRPRSRSQSPRRKDKRRSKSPSPRRRERRRSRSRSPNARRDSRRRSRSHSPRRHERRRSRSRSVDSRRDARRRSSAERRGERSRRSKDRHVSSPQKHRRARSPTHQRGSTQSKSPASSTPDTPARPTPTKSVPANPTKPKTADRSLYTSSQTIQNFLTEARLKSESTSKSKKETLFDGYNKISPDPNRTDAGIPDPQQWLSDITKLSQDGSKAKFSDHQMSMVKELLEGIKTGKHKLPMDKVVKSLALTLADANIPEPTTSEMRSPSRQNQSDMLSLVVGESSEDRKKTRKNDSDLLSMVVTPINDPGKQDDDLLSITVGVDTVSKELERPPSPFQTVSEGDQDKTRRPSREAMDEVLPHALGHHKLGVMPLLQQLGTPQLTAQKKHAKPKPTTHSAKDKNIAPSTSARSKDKATTPSTQERNIKSKATTQDSRPKATTPVSQQKESRPTATSIQHKDQRPKATTPSTQNNDPKSTATAPPIQHRDSRPAPRPEHSVPKPVPPPSMTHTASSTQSKDPEPKATTTPSHSRLEVISTGQTRPQVSPSSQTRPSANPLAQSKDYRPDVSPSVARSPAHRPEHSVPKPVPPPSMTHNQDLRKPPIASPAHMPEYGDPRPNASPSMAQNKDPRTHAQVAQSPAHVPEYRSPPQPQRFSELKRRTSINYPFKPDKELKQDLHFLREKLDKIHQCLVQEKSKWHQLQLRILKEGGGGGVNQEFEKCESRISIIELDSEMTVFSMRRIKEKIRWDPNQRLPQVELCLPEEKGKLISCEKCSLVLLEPLPNEVYESLALLRSDIEDTRELLKQTSCANVERCQRLNKDLCNLHVLRKNHLEKFCGSLQDSQEEHINKFITKLAWLRSVESDLYDQVHEKRLQYVRKRIGALDFHLTFLRIVQEHKGDIDSLERKTQDGPPQKVAPVKPTSSRLPISLPGLSTPKISPPTAQVKPTIKTPVNKPEQASTNKTSKPEQAPSSKQGQAGKSDRRSSTDKKSDSKTTERRDSISEKSKTKINPVKRKSESSKSVPPAKKPMVQEFDMFAGLAPEVVDLTAVKTPTRKRSNSSEIIDLTDSKSSHKIPKKSGSSDAKKSGSSESKKSGSNDSRKSGSNDSKKSGSTDTKKSGSTDPKKASAKDPKKSSAKDPQKSSSTDPKKSSSTDFKKSSSTDAKKSSSTDPKKSSSTDCKNSSSKDPKQLSSTDPKKSGDSKKSSERRSSGEVKQIKQSSDSHHKPATSSHKQSVKKPGLTPSQS